MKVFLPKNINKTITTIVSVDEFVENIDGIKNGNFNVISIRSSDGRMGQDKLKKYDLIDAAKFNNICIGIFDDLQKESDRNTKTMVFPQEKHIFPILEWAKNKWKKNENPFVIHCTAGISRSSAIAIIINRMINNNVKDAFDPNLHYPNKEILRLGEKFLKVSNIVEQVEEKENSRWL
jgi:predicted protein tyrosine phosphatase